MSKYKIAKNKTEDAYEIIEIDNDFIVTVKMNYEDAKEIYELLKKGSGFDGFSPEFFCLKRPSYELL